ncbi:ImmA/IrrE family metallo-endopeptidase [Puniceicoccales bacterium CK1056]|uniref:ImmA/IrrE family metallo-endopeptidase n=1 Tax=Oceanipulchritudo coccoides TaxID=2706888 RepID=A0A6B2M2W9_9BACT|nr:ImmA/IrrE family metallo-endopeptidase [Oceanipulchritudo coccoides]NDV63361.1 ImmA/IrrE family metallo-endopeptidase [Oceanipulchritudo coccoides]
MAITTQGDSKFSEILSSLKSDGIPIDPIKVAREHGISVKNAKFYRDDISGMISKKDDEVLILVNVDEPPYRKRFTIAHELGHYFLHLDEQNEFVDTSINLFRDSSNGEGGPVRAKEIEANKFAAELLMPESKVSALYKDVKSISDLARIFNVSEDAMSIRIARLGLEDEVLK